MIRLTTIDPVRRFLSLKFYPMDERQWLLGTSYNTGIECLQFVPFLVVNSEIFLKFTFHSASLLDEARRWFESSTVICKFVPDGKNRAEKVRVLVYYDG